MAHNLIEPVDAAEAERWRRLGIVIDPPAPVLALRAAPEPPRRPKCPDLNNLTLNDAVAYLGEVLAWTKRDLFALQRQARDRDAKVDDLERRIEALEAKRRR